MYGPPEVQTSTQPECRDGRSAANLCNENLNQGKQLPIPTAGRHSGQTQISLNWKRQGRSNPATPCRSMQAAVKEKIRLQKRKKDTASKNDVFEIEFINDSGAERCVFSEKALKDEGIDPKMWMKYEGKQKPNDLRPRRR